ncbi:hypothetical protein SAMN05192534_11757 [Alteribacillus persepolensis]|uniref:Uncharacterized protein n=1 Tax=Alteribacillus persepolensis TaxID=568899 RepID=A0A1G8GXC3_9BACI|nr:phage holin family protein [Alteribacillus persepolensis]SDH99056.1 hypothetical protein SAMN05192534_11757 [Alteribacillus persepolensis]
MEDKSRVTFTYEIKSKSKTGLKVLAGVFLLIAAAFFVFGLSMLFSDVPGLFFLFLFVAVVLLALARYTCVHANSMQAMKQLLVFKEETIHYFYENKAADKKIDVHIPYSQVTSLYLARGHRLYSAEFFKNIMVYPILIVEWKNEADKDYIAQGMNVKKLGEVLNLVPKSIPLKAMKYDLTFCPMVLMPQVIATSELIEADRERPLDLPFRMAGRFYESPPAWEPPEQKEKKRKRERQNKWLKNGVVGFLAAFSFFVSLFMMPNWEIVDGSFRFEDTFAIDVTYIIVLLLFVYLRYTIIHRDIYPMKRVLLPIGLIGGIFLIGGVLANVLMTVSDGFMDAVFIQVFMSAVLVGVTYIIYVMGWFVWLLLYMLGIIK